MKTDEQIKQNADVYANRIDRGMGFHRYLLIREAYIEGAHSRDEEIEQLQGAVNYFMDVASAAEAELLKLRNQWIDASMQLPPEDKEGSNLSIDCLVLAGNGSSFFEVIAWYDYSGRCWYEKYDFDQTHLDGNKVYYWMELPKCNHIETEGGKK